MQALIGSKPHCYTEGRGGYPPRPFVLVSTRRPAFPTKSAGDTIGLQIPSG